MLLQTFQLTTSQNDEIRQWIEVSAIIVSPLITIILWQLNVSARKRREKMNIVARLPSLLNKYGGFLNEIEKCELNVQAAATAFKTTQIKEDKEVYRTFMTSARKSADELQLKWFDVSSEITELYNRLRLYIAKGQGKELGIMLTDLSKIDLRKFEKEFETATPSTVPNIQATILNKVISEYKTIGYGKKIEDIILFLKKEFYDKKKNPFIEFINSRKRG